MRKKNKTIFAIAVAAVCVAVLVLTAVVLWPASKKTKQEIFHTPEEAVDIALEAMIHSGTEELVFLGADGSPVGMADTTGLADAITSQIEYSLLSVKTYGDQAVAILEIEAPDTLPIVQQAIADMEVYDETVFLERMVQMLEHDPKTTKTTVEVDMVLVEGYWCMITNPEFSDAITGGLISRYRDLQETIMESLKKEGAE